MEYFKYPFYLIQYKPFQPYNKTFLHYLPLLQFMFQLYMNVRN